TDRCAWSDRLPSASPAATERPMGIGISLSRLANRLLAPVGWHLTRVVPTAEPRYYEPAPSCQLAELAGLYSLFLGERGNGFFVEVGAYDGISFSNTSCLAARGWSGMLVEYIPRFAQACRVLYK